MPDTLLDAQGVPTDGVREGLQKIRYFCLAQGAGIKAPNGYALGGLAVRVGPLAFPLLAYSGGGFCWCPGATPDRGAESIGILMGPFGPFLSRPWLPRL